MALEELSKNTGDDLQGLHTSLDSLANVLNSRLAFHHGLAEQGGVFAVINKTCCTYVSNSANTKEIREQKLSGYTDITHKVQTQAPSGVWSHRASPAEPGVFHFSAH